MNTYTDSEREPRGRVVRALARYRPLPTSKNPHFQNEARCTTFLVKMSFICMRMENDFPYQWLSTYPRFETEARVPRVPSSRQRFHPDRWLVLFTVVPRSSPRPRLKTASWFASGQLGFLTIACLI